jgi:hypothetical protein
MGAWAGVPVARSERQFRVDPGGSIAATRTAAMRKRGVQGGEGELPDGVKGAVRDFVQFASLP